VTLENADTAEEGQSMRTGVRLPQPDLEAELRQGREKSPE